MAVKTAVAARPRGTSWMSVIGGWVASVGMLALLAPLAAGYVATRGGTGDDLALAVPAILAVLIAYLVGGYVAGRMAAYATSWHGMMTAFFGLFIVLGAILLAVIADRGYLGDLRIAQLDPSYTGGIAPATVGDALTFGALLGFLATIFAGWLGGLLAPSARAVVTPVETTAPVSRETTVVREPATARHGFRLLPTAGRKGGERVERHEHVDGDGDRKIHETRVDRR